MKKVVLLILILFSALFLIIPVGRAWNGLVFEDFEGRLGAFIFFSVGFLLFPKPKNFNDKLTLGILAFAILLLVAPSVISYFMPKQTNFSDEIQPQQNQDFPKQEINYPFQTEPVATTMHHPKPRVQCLICNGTGTVYCSTCSGTGETYEYKSIVRFTPLQPGESSMIKISHRCIICHGTGKKMCMYCVGKGYRE